MSTHYNYGHTNMMSRKHYVKFADLFANCADDDDATSVREYLLYGMADYFKQDNANFNRERFIAAATATGK